jgi:glucose uptake protein GlcU
MVKPPMMVLIVIVLFALFTWGFVYNMLKQNGFTEPTAQITGVTLALLAIILLEIITRFRIKRLKNQDETQG